MHYFIQPVANKYLAEKSFLKVQAIHEKNIKHVRSVLNRSELTPRPHCLQRAKQTQIKELESARIRQENERLLIKIAKNEAFVDSHNHHVSHSLNSQNRKYQQMQHENELQHLRKRISQVRGTYSAQEQQQDYAKTQVIRKRLSRFSSNKK